MKFPTIVYKKGGNYRDVKTNTFFSCVGVANEEELDIQLKSGAFVDLQDLLNPKAEKAAPVVEEKPAPVDDGEDFKRYEELTEKELHEIKVCLQTEGVDKKALRENYNIHHLTLKKIANELD